MERTSKKKRQLETTSNRIVQYKRQKRNAFCNKQWEELFMKAKFNQCLLEITRDFKKF